jgi:NAD(P)-dependent dehydrogenase (short-subunit alcohol dehydrogenase family)
VVRILLIGATGTLGRAVAKALAVDADLITASRSGEHRVDLTDPSSIADAESAPRPCGSGHLEASHLLPAHPHSPDGAAVSQPIRVYDQAGPEDAPRRGQQRDGKHAADDDADNRFMPHVEIPDSEQGQHYVCHSAPGPL